MDNKFDEGENSVESDFTTQMSVGILKEFVYGRTICKYAKLQIFHQLFLFFEDIFEFTQGRLHFLQ
jgi:hypothetical protein